MPKASDMTNDELAKELEDAAKLYECEDGEEEREEHAILVEAAVRLRSAQSASAELRECLKEAIGCADEFQKFFETHPYLCKYTRDVIKRSKKALEGAKDDSPSCEDN